MKLVSGSAPLIALAACFTSAVSAEMLSRLKTTRFQVPRCSVRTASGEHGVLTFPIVEGQISKI